MVFKRYIYRNGKKLGPYFYENKKVNGKVVSTYLGKKHSSQNKKILLIVILIAAIISLLTYIAFKFEYLSTGHQVISSESSKVSYDSPAEQQTEKSVIPITNKEPSVNTVQKSAIINFPVVWTKEVKLSSQGSINVNIPKQADNIVVYKISSNGKKEKVSESSLKITAKASSEIKLEEKSGISSFFKKIFNFLTGKAVDVQSSEDSKTVVINENEKSYEVIYETPAPQLKEEISQRGKRTTLYSEIIYTQVITFTTLPEEWNIEDSSKISIYWENQNKYISPEKVEDRDENGIYDYIEWISPSSGNQTFEIIVIKKAEHLNSKKVFISDIFSEVRELDELWSEPILDQEYVRVTFEKNLTPENDITIFPLIIDGEPRIEVYEKDSDTIIAEFSNITSNDYNTIFLSNLQETQDTFDLKIVGGSMKFDHIVDPYINTTNGNWITQTGTTYRTVHALSWTAEVNSRYLVMVFGEARHSATNSDSRVGIYQNGVEQFLFQDRPAVALTEIMPFSAMQVYEGSGSTVTYDVRISSSSASATSGVRNMRIIAIRLDNMTNSHYNYTYNTNEQANVNNVWGNAAGDTDEITFTPSTQGYYMIWAGASVSSGSTTSSASWRVNIDNGQEFLPYPQGGEATWSYARVEDRSTSERVNFNLVAVRHFSTSSHSIKMQYADIDATASADWRDRSVIVMRLSDVFSNWWNSSSISQLSTTSTTFQTNANLPQPSSNGDYIVLGSQALRGDSASVDFEQQLSIDSASYGLRAWRPKDVLDYSSESFITNFTVSSGSHSSAMQYRRQDASGTAFVKNSELLILGPESPSNSIPFISYIEPISPQLPLESSTRDVNFEVRVSDIDGVNDINDSSVNANFTLSGEPTRIGTCTWQSDRSATEASYRCGVSMQYYDKAGSWTINVAAEDLQGEKASNSSNSFTYQELKSMTINSPIGSLSWPLLNSSSLNVQSTNDPNIIENTGNYEGAILITAHNLVGQTTPSDIISASNFRASPNSGSVCSGTQLQNALQVSISGSLLTRGASSTEQIYYCLTSVPLVSSQSYSATAANSWIIEV